ncbi:MAG: GNAT family N-acetyltransferase [Candidatus Thermoplasmatota archaeon]|nr:GNAT family N-acetyltransferase [Candidatus Thermoplasmatota archaeon]
MVYIPDIISVDTDLQLRVPMESDARTLFNLVEENRTYLREWLPWLDETKSVQDEVDFIQDQARKHQTADGSLFLLESLDVGVIGTLSVNQVDHGNLTAWIGYWLDQGHTGKGIMTRTVGALVDVLLVSCGFNRVVIETGVDNSASSGIPLRLGFREEGRSVQRQWMYDRWVDSFQYAITASEWRAKP